MKQFQLSFPKNLLAIAITSVTTMAIGATEQDADFFEQIKVTGSRIPITDNDVSLQPVTVLDEASLRATGALTVADALNELTMFGDGHAGGSSINLLNKGFSADTKTVNLRNLGDRRTLVLINGRRHVGGDVGTSSVDLNSIPTGLIERIEVLTGGASAVYGADAVSGVVNVILKREFVGNQLALRTGASGEDDAKELAVLYTHGNWFDGGSYQFSLEYTDQQPVYGKDRDFSQFDGSAVTGLSEASNGSGVTPQGSYISPALGNGRFDTNGEYVPGLGLERFQRMPTRSLINTTERILLSGHVDFNLDANTNLFIEGTYNNTITGVQFDPQLAIFNDASFASSGTAGFRFPTASLVAIDGINTGNNLGGDLRVSNRRLLEYGARESEIERTLTRIVFGLEGLLGSNDYELYYQYGQVDAEQTDFDTIDKLRFMTAIDPTTCSATSDCVFADIYGRGTLSRASLSYVADDLSSHSDSSQHVLGGYLTGYAFVFNNLQATYVAGFEYRDEAATITPHNELLAVLDPITGSDNLVGLKGTRTFFGNTDSSYDVAEVFGELNFPISELIDIGISARFSDYSTVGSEFTYGITGDFILNDSIRLRGSAGKATRAPNIRELAAPGATTTVEIADPCDTLTDDNTPLTPAANCSNFVDTSFNPNDLDRQIRGISGGNKALDSETASTFTLGAVLTIDETIVSLDYYQIAMEDVLANAFSAQATIDRCIGTLDSFFCNNVSRDTTTGVITSVRSEQSNLAEENTAGIELTVQHTWKTNYGDIQWFGIYSHLLEHTRKVNDLADEENLEGRVDNIENKLNTTFKFSNEIWYAGVTLRYLDAAVQRIDTNPTIALGNDIDAVVYADIFAGFQATNQLSVSGGIENLTDEKAPVVTQLYENNGSADTTAPGVYDVRGLFAYIQAAYKF